MDPKNNLNEKNKRLKRTVGFARNEFGTRLCQRVVCSRCQKIDYVSVRVFKSKEKFCRDCAERVLNTYDQGRYIEEKKVSRICEICGYKFLIFLTVAQKKANLLCADCYRGFFVWRKKDRFKRSAITK